VDPVPGSDSDRAPCPRCGESTALVGRVCPHCDASLLVDVSVTAPIADERRRYRAARELAVLSGVPLARLRDRLAQPGGGVVLTAVTRDAGRRAVAALDGSGAAARVEATPLFAGAAEVPELGREIARNRVPPLFFVLAAAAAAVVVGLLVLKPGAPPKVAPAAPENLPTAGAAAPTPSSHDLAAAALTSTVALRCGDASGAGFFVATDLVATNAHLLCADRASLQATLHDGRRLPASVVASDDWLDAALLRVPGAGMPPLPVGDATRLDPGDVVLFIGSPLGMDFSVSRAIVSHPRRNVYGIAFVQFDANVNPGNSGGPLLDTQGRAVGIVSMMILDSRGLAFALPVNYLRDLPGASLPIGEPAPDFAAWRRVVASVQQQDATDAAAARDSFRLPALGGAAVDSDGRLVAFVVTVGRPAGSRSYAFSVRRGGQVLCRPTGVVDMWGTSSASIRERDPRYIRWLKRIGVGADLYSGSAELSTAGCPDPRTLMGAEIDLEGAQPGASRTLIDAFRTVP
jgi:serine protease Do